MLDRLRIKLAILPGDAIAWSETCAASEPPQSQLDCAGWYEASHGYALVDASRQDGVMVPYFKFGGAP